MPGGGAAFWPASGLYMGVLAALDRRHWPGVIAAALPAEAIASAWLFDFPLAAALGTYTGNTLEAVAGAALLRRVCGAPLRLHGLRDVVALAALGAGIASALGATIGAATLTAIDRGEFWQSWLLWWTGDGDGAGVLIAAPLALWAFETHERGVRPPAARWAEALAVLAVLTALAHLVLTSELPLSYALLPPALWAAVRFEVPGAVAATSVLTVMAVRYTAGGADFFANGGVTPEAQHWLLMLFVAVTAVFTLTAAALTRQRREAWQAREHAYAELEQVVQERTAELRASEERARTAHERFTATLRASPVAAFRQDRSLRYTWANNAALGLQPESIIGTTDHELFGREDADRLAAIKRRVLETGEPARLEVPIHAEGRLYWYDLSVQAERDDGGGIVGVVCTAVDITDRKTVQEALQASAARLQRIINVEGIGVFIFDAADGTLIDANDAFLALSGYARSDIEARSVTWRSSTPPDDVEVTEAQMELLGKTGRIGPYETEWLRPDGSRVWVLLAGASLGDGTVVEYCIDVSARKRAEQALREADRRKDEFLAVLGHELRSPLAPLRNAVEILRLAGDRRAVAEQARATIERQVIHMGRLVDDLLDVARIARGVIELKRERVDIAEVVQTAIGTVRPQVDAARHDLTVSLSELWLRADPVRLAQVIANLLNNAVKYTPPGGQIAVSTERRGNEAVVRIKDSGVGIPPEKLHEIFEMFAQVKGSVGQSQGGLGIGLTLVKRLVELHGGRVEAHSEGVSRGSEFVVVLPLGDQDATRAAPPRAQEN